LEEKGKIDVYEKKEKKKKQLLAKQHF